ncbi:nucleolar protein 56-like [Sapajus apella]|uniref:Nucleolar protein 56-like n=1 Tax=Sapajus apella TaxID=9515 RepID=A0A6J3IIQ2_SAPAP|nr:nucleolar protein 56-like [Sapajus apella]
MNEKPKKKKKQKPQEVPQENGKEDISLSPNPRKINLFKELLSSDLEEMAGSTSLPKRKKSSPKEDTVNDPEEAGNRSVSKKKRKPSKEEPVSSGP